MALLYFKVKSDYEQVIKLREEIERLKAVIKTVDANKNPSIARSLVKDVTSAQKELRSLETAAAKAGFTVERDFKSKILEGSRTVNTLTSKIIEQREVVRGVESDVRRLSLAYSSMYKGSSKTAALTELNAAKKALVEEKNTLFGLQQEQSKARLSVRGLKDEYATLTTGVNQSNISLKSILGTLGGVAVLRSFASNVVNIRAEMEMMGKSFEVLLGSKEKSDAYMVQIKDFALKSPLSVSDVSKGAQTLLGFNIEAERTIPILKQLGDISMGDSGRFSSLVLAFAQMSAAGKLMGQDLLQMINAGFNPLMYISEKTGKSISELRKDMENGAISSKMVADAFDSATKQGGKFYGMTDKVSQGVQAARNQLQGAIMDTSNAFGEKNQALIVGGYNAIQTLVENYDTLGRILVGLIGTYGVYKVALMYAIEAEKGYTLSQIITTRTLLLTEKAQKALNLAILKNPYAIAAVAIVTLVTAMWALHDSTTAAEKAQKRFNEEQEKNTEIQDQKRSDINKLISTIKDQTETEQEKISAYEKLIKLSPTLTDAYSREKIALMELADINKTLNEERDKTDYGKLIEEIDKLENKLKDLKKANGQSIGQGSSMVSVNLDNSSSIRDTEALIKVYKDKKNSLDDLMENTEWQKNLVKVSNQQLQGDYDARKRILDKMSVDGSVKTGNIVGGSLEGSFSKSELEKQTKILKDELDKRSAKLMSYNELRLKLEKDLSTEEAKLESIRSNKSGKMTEAQFNDAIKTQEAEVKKRRDALEAVIGKKTEKEDVSAIETQKKISELNQKQAQERSKLEIDLQYKTEQAKIDAMKNGAEKTLLQMELDHKKELEALELEKNELLVKKRENAKALFDANPKNKGKVFSGDSSLTSEESSSFSSRTASIKLKQSNEIKKYYEDLNKEFETYKQKRERIAKEYDEKILNLSDANKTVAQKEKSDALETIDNEFAAKQGNFTSWAAQVSKLSIDQLMELLRQAEEELLKAKMDMKVDDKDYIAGAKVSKIRQLLKSKNDELSPGEKNIKKWQDLHKTLGDISNEFKEIGEAVGGSAGEMLKSAGQMASSTLSMISGIVTLSNTASTAVLTTVQAVERASIILSIVSAALSIATKISDALTGRSRAEIETERLQDITESIKEANEAINNLIEERIELMKQASLGEKVVLASSTQSVIDLQKSNIDSKIQGSTLGMMKKGKGGIVKDYYTKNFSSVKELKEYLGSEEYIKAVNGGFELYNEDFYKGIVTQYDDLLKQEKELKDATENLFTGITFDDVKDSFDDLLLSAETTSEDIADSFESTMKQAMLNILKEDYINAAMRKWYDNFVSYSEDGLSSSESDLLKNNYSYIFEQAQDKLKSMMDTIGIDSSYSQSSTSGGFQSMSQDTADELNGRFTAIQMSGEEVKNQSILQTQSLNVLSSKADSIILSANGIRDIADEMRTIQVNSYLELRQISENTGAIIKPIKAMAEDIAIVKQNTSRI